jgi:carboxyl-terminal processing protease
MHDRLEAQHVARVSKDPEFRWWAEDVARFREERDDKVISLNEAKRRAERDELVAERKKRDAERRALGLEVDESARTSDDGLSESERSIAQQTAEEEAAKKRPDPLLREAAAILADALDLLSGNDTLTAQVLPNTREPTVWAE